MGVGIGEVGLGDGVVFDDVDLGRHALGEFPKFLRVLQRVVEVVEQDVLERDSGAGFLVEIRQCIAQDRQRVAFVDGHDLIALRIVGRVERQSEVKLDCVVAELPDHFGDARRRNRDAFGRHTQPVSRSDPVDGFQHVFVIQQRFAHAHVDNVGQRCVVVFLRLPVNGYHLIVDFGRVEVAFAIHVARRAEFARQRTPYLTRHAGRHAWSGSPVSRSGVPVVVRSRTGGPVATAQGRNQHTFHQVTVIQPERRFDGTVVAALLLIDGQGPNFKISIEQLPRRQRQIGHVPERQCRLFPKPFVHLLSPKTGFAVLYEPVLNLVGGEFAYVLFHCLTSEQITCSPGIYCFKLFLT